MEGTQQLEYDAQGTPIHATEYDAQGNPIGAPSLPSSKPQPPSPMTVTPQIASDMFKAGVHAKILGVTPGAAYESKDEIDKTIRERGGNYDDGKLDPTIMNDITAGVENSIFGLYKRKALPEQVRNPKMMDSFISGVSQMVADAPIMYVSGIGGKAVGSLATPVVGGIAGGAAAFAVPAGIREALVQGIKHGDVSSVSDLLRRTAAVTWAATKGAVVGAATELAGGLPVGKFLSKSSVTATAVKGLYQATALTTAADLLEGKLPSKGDFAGNAALIVPLNLVTHGLFLQHAEANQALLDVYAKDGKTPQDSTDSLHAQPPVKPDLPEGLKPAINLADGVVDGDTSESHADLSERVLAKRAVSMDELEKDPAKADRVLENPVIHEQDVIDRAWELKSESIDAGDVPRGTVYHGTPSEYEGVPRTDGLGAHFTPDRNVAESVAGEGGWVISARLGIENPLRVEDFGGSHSSAEGTIKDLVKQGVLPDSYLKDIDTRIYERSEKIVGDIGDLQGPELAAKRNAAYEQANREKLEKVKSYLKSKGYDGLVYENKVEGGGDSHVAFDEKQINDKPLRIEDLYDRASMKSGRGFVTPDGEFLTRDSARKWVKDNEPDIHETWLNEQDGDKQATFHSQDYAEARNRVQGRNVAEGDPLISNLDPQNAQRLAAARSGLNKIKAGEESTGYGKEVLRTLFVGQRDARVAATTQLRDSIKKLIPDFHDQEALSILRDYKDEPERLAADLDDIRAGDSERMKQLIPSIERAMNPTPALLEADQKLTDYYSSALNEGRQLGFMESSIDPSHYSPHILTRILDGEQPSAGRRPMASSTPFAKERSYPTILDALKTGHLDARTVNALDALSVYGDRHATVVATKLLATELKNTELGKYGTQAEHPSGWVPMDQGAFRQGAESLYVPKEVADALKPMFESGLKDTGFAFLLKAQGYVKSLELGLSLFHVKALNITAFNNMGLADFTRSITADIKSPEFLEQERGWAADGLTTSKTSTPYEAYRGLQKSSVGESTGLARLKDNALVKTADAAFKKTTEYTFDVVQRKFKVQDASLKVASWMAKHPAASNEELFAARRSIAREVNAAYGGLNWDVLGTGKTVRDVSRLFLLAPDWTFSNVLNAKYSFEGGPAGNAARMFWAKSFATGFAMTAAMSIAIGGKYDPTDIKHIDQVYLGKDEKGKEMYANWFFAGAPKDAITLAKRSAADSPLGGTAEFVVSKASPALGLFKDLSSNTRGGSKIPISKNLGSTKKDGTEYDRVDQIEDQAKYAAGRVVPITGVSAVKTVADALSDPNHDYSYKDLLELAADSLGAQTTHSAPAGGASKSSSVNRFQKAGGKSRFTVKKR